MKTQDSCLKNDDSGYLKTLNKYYLGEVEKIYFYQQTCPGESSHALHVFFFYSKYACVIVYRKAEPRYTLRCIYLWVINN